MVINEKCNIGFGCVLFVLGICYVGEVVLNLIVNYYGDWDSFEVVVMVVLNFEGVEWEDFLVMDGIGDVMVCSFVIVFV